MVHFSVPADYSVEYIKGLKEIVKENKKSNDFINDVYGTFPKSYIGHSRSPDETPKIKYSELSEFISELRRLNLKYFFVINNPWSNLRERKESWRSLILKEIEKLIDLGVKGFIVGNPYIIAWIKKEFSFIKINASINLGASSFNEIKELIYFGADKVVIDRDLNRNFKFIRLLGKNFPKKIILLLNVSCIPWCPLKTYHSITAGYFTLRNKYEKEDSIEKQKIIDKNFCLNYCRGKILQDPSLLLKIPWILPEMIKDYEDLGISFFKIQGRSLNIEQKLLLIKSYINRTSPSENLSYLWPNLDQNLNLLAKKMGITKEFKISDFKIIPNIKSFMQFFEKNNYNCQMGCQNCNYCSEFFNKIN